MPSAPTAEPPRPLSAGRKTAKQSPRRWPTPAYRAVAPSPLRAPRLAQPVPAACPESLATRKTEDFGFRISDCEFLIGGRYPLASLISQFAIRNSLERDADGFHDLEEHGLGLFTASHRRGITRADREPVREDRNHKSLDIVRQAVTSLFSKRQRLGRAKERERAARADTQIQHLRGT